MSITLENSYNGWSNYATWRIKLELFDDSSQYKDHDAETLKELAQDAVRGYGELKEDCLAVQYADAFLEEVDWREIAEAIENDNKEIEEYEEKQNE